jgi:hypothetical protein
MIGQGNPHQLTRNRKNNNIPLSKLLTVDAVKTVLDNPQRIEELLVMLEDKELRIRGIAAATIAHLSESHPARLLTLSERFQEYLDDDFAYVRWHLVYALGRLCAYFPSCDRVLLGRIIAHLDDPNRLVRVITNKVLVHLAVRHPLIIEEYFSNLKQEIPPSISRWLHTLHRSVPKPAQV